MIRRRRGGVQFRAWFANTLDHQPESRPQGGGDRPEVVPWIKLCRLLAVLLPFLLFRLVQVANGDSKRVGKL